MTPSILVYKIKTLPYAKWISNLLFIDLGWHKNPMNILFQAISNCMHFALDFLSNTQKESLASLYLAVPEPLEARDYDAQVLFPWRSFINR